MCADETASAGYCTSTREQREDRIDAPYAGSAEVGCASACVMLVQPPGDSWRLCPWLRRDWGLGGAPAMIVEPETATEKPSPG
jgi:hypothetical protein